MFNSSAGGDTVPPSRCLTRYGRVTSKGYPALGTCTSLRYHFYNATCPHRCIHESLSLLYQLGNYYGRYKYTAHSALLPPWPLTQLPAPSLISPVRWLHIVHCVSLIRLPFCRIPPCFTSTSDVAVLPLYLSSAILHLARPFSSPNATFTSPKVSFFSLFNSSNSCSTVRYIL